MSVAQVVRSRPRHRSFTSIRRQLLQTRRTLLLQAATWTPPQTEQENPTDVLDIPLLRLRAQPDATLCVTCKCQCEERTLLRVGA